MSENQVTLESIFQNIRDTKRLPVIFIGSGITKRYTDKKYSWEGLLKRCIEEYDDDPTNKYKSRGEEYEKTAIMVISFCSVLSFCMYGGTIPSSKKGTNEPRNYE
ncbi:hypothetical protein MKY25_03390 [Geobacillus sp. FSL W8-0032]|uniref:hypothetical protein n=1 Tax=Geobacillus TaxID=129337 RepID=UPI002D77CF48|nr:hypothetical protein [Geobacillus icigianus]